MFLLHKCLSVRQSSHLLGFTAAHSYLLKILMKLGHIHKSSKEFPLAFLLIFFKKRRHALQSNILILILPLSLSLHPPFVTCEFDETESIVLNADGVYCITRSVTVNGQSGQWLKELLWKTQHKG